MSEKRVPYLYGVHIVVAAAPETWAQHEVRSVLLAGANHQYSELDCGHIIPNHYPKGEKIGCPLCAYLEERVESDHDDA